MRYSILLPVYNGGERLREAIESILSCTNRISNSSSSFDPVYPNRTRSGAPASNLAELRLTKSNAGTPVGFECWTTYAPIRATQSVRSRKAHRSL